MTRDECVDRFVEVRGGYKAMNGGVHVRDAKEEEMTRARDAGRYRRGGSLMFLGSKTWWTRKCGQPHRQIHTYIYRSGYWSGNQTHIPVAIGPAIGHVQGTDGKRQSDSCVYFVCVASVNRRN